MSTLIAILMIQIVEPALVAMLDLLFPMELVQFQHHQTAARKLIATESADCADKAAISVKDNA